MMMAYCQSLVLSVLVHFSVKHCSVCTTVVYHVLPSSSDACPSQRQPCLTLSQFSANTSNYLYSSTALNFRPGNHSLDTTLNIKAITFLQLIESNSVFPLGSSIVCEHSSNLDLHNVSFVHIRRLGFIGCSGVRGELIGQLLIEDSSFLGQTRNSSSSLEVVRSSVKLTGATSPQIKLVN